jgi:hypothetical protein
MEMANIEQLSSEQRQHMSTAPAPQTAQIPIELIQAIIIAGTTEAQYGKNFGAKCMRLARWVQPIVAPLLYSRVAIETEGQMRSLLFALQSNGYLATKLVKILIIRKQDKYNNEESHIWKEDDNDVHHDTVNLRGNETKKEWDAAFWAQAILRVTHLLDPSTWEEFQAPVSLLNHESTRNIHLEAKNDNIKGGYVDNMVYVDYPGYRMPPRVTFIPTGSLFPYSINYQTIRKLRFLNSSLPFHRIIQFITPPLTHLAIQTNGPPSDVEAVRKTVEAASSLQCVLILVMCQKAVDSPEQIDEIHEDSEGVRQVEDSRWELLKLKTPRLLMWKADEMTKSLYYDDDTEALWARVEQELTDPERSDENFERMLSSRW